MEEFLKKSIGEISGGIPIIIFLKNISLESHGEISEEIHWMALSKKKFFKRVFSISRGIAVGIYGGILDEILEKSLN